ncbi:MAG: hypothetical protein AAF559_04140 [Pseudomonadota bacterium]
MIQTSDKLKRVSRFVTYGLVPCAVCMGAMPQGIALDPASAQSVEPAGIIIAAPNDEDDEHSQKPQPKLDAWVVDDGLYSVIDDLEDVITIDAGSDNAKTNYSPSAPSVATLDDIKQMNAAIEAVLNGDVGVSLSEIAELSGLTGFYRDRLEQIDPASFEEEDRAYFDELKRLGNQLSLLESDALTGTPLQNAISMRVSDMFKSTRFDFEADIGGLRSQIAQLGNGCPYNTYIRLNKDVSRLQKMIDFVFFELGPDEADADTYRSARNNIANAQALPRDLELFCEPEWALREIRAISLDCDLPTMREYYTILQVISDYADFELRHVNENGTHGVLTQPLAKARYDAAQRALREADQMLENCTPPDEIASADESSEQTPAGALRATPVAYLPDEPANPGRSHCDEEEEDRMCRAWTPLLGAWTSPEFGGEIEFRLQGNNTVSAFVSRVSERMRMQGYTKGMLIARGLKTPKSGGTWSFFAGGGEAFDAAQPGATGSLGQAKWTPDALVHINVKEPGVLNLPATLEGNLSDYNEWVRPGTSDACPTTNTDCRTFEPVLGAWTNPTHGGIVEFRQDGEDTVSAYVVSANPIMRDQGFTGGMAILRGLRLNPTGNTWSFAAGRGEVFSPKHPDRDPGQIYGAAKWNENALVFINVAKPNLINMPPELKARMGNYTEWVRAGTRTR